MPATWIVRISLRSIVARPTNGVALLPCNLDYDVVFVGMFDAQLLLLARPRGAR
jgi:hypothetical protein